MVSCEDLPLTVEFCLRGGGANCVFVSIVGRRCEVDILGDFEGISRDVLVGKSGFLNSFAPIVRACRPGMPSRGGKLGRVSGLSSLGELLEITKSDP